MDGVAKVVLRNHRAIPISISRPQIRSLNPKVDEEQRVGNGGHAPTESTSLSLRKNIKRMLIGENVKTL